MWLRHACFFFMFQDSEGALVPPKIYLGMVPSVEGQSKQYAGRRREMLNPGTGNFRVSRAAIAIPWQTFAWNLHLQGESAFGP